MDQMGKAMVRSIVALILLLTLGATAAYTQSAPSDLLGCRDQEAACAKFGSQYGVVAWPDTQALTANPFPYKGKVIGTRANFTRMLSENEALFGDLIITNVASTQFTDVDRPSVVIFKIDGLRVLKVGLGGEVSVPFGRFVGVYFCTDGDCKDFFSVSNMQFDAGNRSLRIRRGSNGHFTVNANVNGVSLIMLIDTGASTVVLKPADAQRLGIDVDGLKYTVPVQTSTGTTYAAHVRLRNLALGPISLNDVDALVAKPGALKENLLGISFLSRLRSYEFTTDMLTLRS
jgi:clan AA aspartic protease (TIGR02281 family)